MIKDEIIRANLKEILNGEGKIPKINKIPEMIVKKSTKKSQRISRNLFEKKIKNIAKNNNPILNNHNIHNGIICELPPIKSNT